MSLLFRYDEYDNFADAIANFWERQSNGCPSDGPLYERWEEDLPVMNEMLAPWNAKFHYFKSLSGNPTYKNRDDAGLFEFETEADLMMFILQWK